MDPTATLKKFLSSKEVEEAVDQSIRGFSEASNSHTPPTTTTGNSRNDSTSSLLPDDQTTTREWTRNVLMLVGLTTVLKMFYSTIAAFVIVAFPFVWLYAKQTCPKEESFDVKKELKRVLRGYHLPDTHPDKPKGYFESITARVTASVTAEIATLPGGVQVVKRPLWGVAIITTAQVPNTNMQYMWIGAFGTWYYINGKALGPSPSTGSKVDHKKNSDSSKKD